MNVLVTRPKPFGEILAEKLRANGFHPIYFPTIEIIPVHAEITQLNQFDWIIFVSPQAVHHSKQVINPQIFQGKVAAVGASTANALKIAGFSDVVYPEKQWSSEGLLSLPEFQEVRDQRILLIHGQGGREVLDAELRKRGAEVEHYIAYQRKLPKNANQIDWSNIDVIICTSVENLENLLKLCEEKKIRNIPLLVASERIKSVATKHHFKNIFLAENASDEAIIQVLQQKRDFMTPEKTQSHHNGNSKWGILSTSVITSTLVVIVFMIGFWFLAIETKQEKRLLQESRRLSMSVQEMQKNMELLQVSQNQLTDATSRQEKIINELKQSQQMHSSDYIRAEAQYLVKIANNQLQFENNPDRALQLLQMAGQLVSASNDASLLTIQKAIEEDMIAVKNAPRIDVAGVYLHLSSLSDVLAKVPLQQMSASDSLAPMPTDSQKLSWWKRGLQETSHALKQIVVVKKMQDITPPFIPPDQQIFFYQNIQSQIENAKWALLHRQNDVYQKSFQQSIAWIQHYAVQDAPTTKELLAKFVELQKIDVSPAMPALTNSLSAFQNIVNGSSS